MKKNIIFIGMVCILLTACAIFDGNSNDTELEKVLPLPSTTDVNNLNDSTVAISLKEGDVFLDDTGVLQMKVMVYDYDLYDMIDISQLEVGDVIVIGNKDVKISALERNSIGTVIINGGLEQGGNELGTSENGVFYEIGYNDAKSYYPIGEATFRVSTDFKYSDKSNLDAEEKIYYPGDFLTEDSEIEYSFNPHNTSIVIENGQVILMNRVYVP